MVRRSHKFSKLVDDLEPIIQDMVLGLRIMGMKPDDVAQELRLLVFNDYWNLSKYRSQTIPWWKQRLKWRIYKFYRSTKRSKDMLDHSVSLDSIRYKNND